MSNRLVFGLLYGLIMLGAVALGPWVFGPLMTAAGIFAVGEVRALTLTSAFSRRARLLWQIGVGLAFVCWALLGFGGRDEVFALLIGAFAFDTAAYFGGRRFGGKKMAPTISPNKTWAGFVCGCAAIWTLLVLASALGAAIFIAAQLLTSPSTIFMGLAWALGIGLVLALISFILGLIYSGGDLLISRLKRQAGVKDSGTLIPGHGGILDRMDSLLLIGPIALILGL